MPPIDIHPKVREAVDAGHPIVALESALITHGFSYPANIEITHRMSQAIEERGALAAVVGIWRGTPTVGLSESQIETLAATPEAVKVSIRDLALGALQGGCGGATVAATMTIAQRAGLRVFATGGIGGVHRGHPQDISADLPALAATPMIVVCAGAKAILDLPRTLEFLETWGVPVLGWQTGDFPAFYSRTSGLGIDARVNSAGEVASIFHTQRALQLPQGILLAAPIPAPDAIPAEEIEPLITEALRAAEQQNVSGKAVTPFLLAQLVELSQERTRKANESLLVNNAGIAAEIAAALAD
ncbi:MAG: pseudouridine-5'-phosphate glycosidase [Anaerolineae bacterium]|nr:pseudouridine-5'-phosphate glycosidase [Anaerolineae bacterium]